MTVTSPKRSDGTYTTPFRVTFSTDGTAGVFVTYTTKIASVDSSGSTAVARDPDEDDFPVSSGSSGGKGKVDLRYNGKIVIRAKSFKSGCLPSPVTEVVLVARKETQADIGDADRPEKGMTKVRSAVRFNASFVDGFNFEAFEIALYTVIVREFTFVVLSDVHAIR